MVHRKASDTGGRQRQSRSRNPQNLVRSIVRQKSTVPLPPQRGHLQTGPGTLFRAEGGLPLWAERIFDRTRPLEKTKVVVIDCPLQAEFNTTWCSRRESLFRIGILPSIPRKCSQRRSRGLSNRDDLTNAVVTDRKRVELNED